MPIRIKRVPSGVFGLDELIQGGFPESSVNIISGPAGAAKTLFCSQFIYNGAKAYGENGLYLSLEETRESLMEAMEQYGMRPKKLIDEGKLFIVDLGGMSRRSQEEEEEGLERKLVGFDTLRSFIDVMYDVTNIKRVVIDSIVAVALFYDSEEELRQEMFRFTRYLKSKNLTALMITEAEDYTGHETRFGLEQFIGDSYLALALEKLEGEFRRTITVLKMRSTKHDSGTHPFYITKTGIEIATNVTI
ncbi:MAG: ATPase domain-containing protein [Thermoplasmata archaeon]